MASGARMRKSTSTPELRDGSALNSVERLIFAQAVHEFGSNAWQEVAKLLSKHPLIAQPKGVFTPQSCATLYKRLMEDAGLEWSENDTAPRSQRHLRLAQRFYVARITELRGLIAAEEAKFRKIASEIDEIRSGAWDNKILASMGVEPVLQEPEIEAEIPQEVEEPEPPKPEDRLEEEEEEEEPASLPEQVEADHPSGKDEEPVVEDVIDISESPPPPPEPDTDEKDEGSDNEAVNVLIDDFGSDKPTADAQERGETPSAREHPSPQDTDATDDMQVDDEETAKVAKASSEPPVETSKRDGSAAIEIDAQEPSETNECEPEPKPEPEPEPEPEARLSARVEGKRKASEDDSMSLDAERDKKRPREDSEPVDDDEGRSAPQTPSHPEPEPQPTVGASKTRRNQRPGNGETAVVSKRFQNMIGMLHSQISQHRFGNIFHNPIKKSEAPDYSDIVKRPMDLKTIKSRVKDGFISNSLEFQRDIFLMFANAMMYNRPGSEIYNMAEEMMASSEREINAFRQTEGFHRM